MEEKVTALQQFINTVITFCVNYSFQALGALIILFVGFLVSNWTGRVFFAFLTKKNLDITLAKFLATLVRMLVLGFAVLIALGNFGVTIAPFVAALGALTFGASFAIQGPLSNYGAGLSIILSRPFVVGNTITVQEVSGVVENVSLACTILRNEDGVKITIPNKDIVGQILYNSQAVRIIESEVGISYNDDPEKAINVVRDTLKKFDAIVQEPAPMVGVQAFADSSITLGYRYWVPTVKYFQTLYAVNLAIYKAFNETGITMPFPQMEVRLLNQTAKV